MFNPFDVLNPNLIIFLGMIGLFLGNVFFFIFIKRRIFKIIGREEKKIPGVMGSARNLISILLLTAIGGLLLFLGFFFIAYHNFTDEITVATVQVEPISDKKCNLLIEEFLQGDKINKYRFEVIGDQWMIEGDILKWEDYMTFIGLDTRYRLNRVRGRFIKTDDEIKNQPTIHSLVEDEEDFLWNILYDIGHKLPFVNTVYGNAAFQLTDKPKKFEVFVTTSGFGLREVK